MKFLLLIFTFISTLSFAQTGGGTPPPAPSAPVYHMVEVMPQYPGGQDAMDAFIKSNMKYPRAAHENSKDGKVVIECIVNTDGSLSDFKVKTAIWPKLDEEAMRIVKLMPAFKPGSQKGKVVPVMISIPVNFVLPKD